MNARERSASAAGGRRKTTPQNPVVVWANVASDHKPRSRADAPSQAVAAQRPAPVPPSVGAVASGKWRNVFVEAGYAQADIDAKVQAAYQQLFHGDPATQAIYTYVAAENSSYVSDIKNKDVRSEGMGYGMMVTVQLDLQSEFDALYTWVRLHMQHRDTSDYLGYYGWSAWHCRTNGQIIDAGPAPDG